MPLIIHSPHSGEPVKVRDQDLGRAIRDKDGKIFYVVERSDGSGHYAALTRKGSPKDEERYDKLLKKDAQASEHRQQVAQDFHDATGKRRKNPARLVLAVLVAAGLGYGAYWYWQQQQSPAAPALPTPTEQVETPDAPPSVE